MISSRCSVANALAATISPPFGALANVVTARSISPASRGLIALTSTPTDCATDWMTANWPIPDVIVGSRRTAARVRPGAICLSSSSHLPLKLYSNWIKPVALPPGCDKLSTNPAPTGSATFTNTIGTVRLQEWPHGRGAGCKEDIRCERDQFARVSATLRRTATGPSGLHLHVAALGPAQWLQRLRERSEVGSLVYILGRIHKHADAPHPLALLRARRERPRGRRSADERHELAALHSITSSATDGTVFVPTSS